MRKYVLIVMLIFLGGCASRSPRLELDNILDEIEKKAAARQAASEEADSESQEGAEDGGETESDEVAVPPEFDPPEFSFLGIPKDFAFLDEDSTTYQSIADNIGEFFPGLSYVWRHKDLDLFIAAGTIPLNRKRMERLDDETLKQEMKRLADAIETYYSMKFQGKTEYHIRPGEEVRILQVKSKFTSHGFQRIDLRHIFFYNSDFRLNLMMSGRLEHYILVTGDWDVSLIKFRNGLKKVKAAAAKKGDTQGGA